MTFLSSLPRSSSVVVACGYREPNKHSEFWKLWLLVVPAGCEKPQPLMESMHLEHANLFKEGNAFKRVYRMELVFSFAVPTVDPRRAPQHLRRGLRAHSGCRRGHTCLPTSRHKLPLHTEVVVVVVVVLLLQCELQQIPPVGILLFLLFLMFQHLQKLKSNTNHKCLLFQGLFPAR